jgi:choline dehydrogenase-like flavoprotein
MTQTRATRLVCDATGRITAVEVLKNGQPQTIEAESFALAAGAVQTAALLLGSVDARHPKGLANLSDQVGRNFMNHNASAVLAVHPFRANRSIYQKTFQINDFYLKGGPGETPLGNIQLLGKISGTILKSSSPLPGFVANWIAKHSYDFYAMSEDLPDPESRVTLKDGQICLDWRRSNWEAHLLLVKTLKAKLRAAGFPLVLSRPFDRKTPSHQCGTARMGADPRTSVVNPFSQTHQHENLFITDASVLPTSAAVNPALTIAALSLRAARRMSA